jgi:hypothetical protein
MTETLEQLSRDIRNALKADAGIAGKKAICGLVSKVLLDQDFIARHLTADSASHARCCTRIPSWASAFAAMCMRRRRTARR